MNSTSEQSQVTQSGNVSRPSNRTQDVKVARVQSSLDQSDRVEAFLHGVSLVLRHHAAPFEVVKSFREQGKTFLTVSEEGIFLKRAKYMILWPMSRYLRNEEPPSADLPFHYSGRFWRWAKPRLLSYSRKNTHLWYSFLQSKRAALPVSSDIVFENFEKHRRQMEMPDPLREGCEGSDELLEEVMGNLDPVLRKLQKILKQELLDFFRNPEREIHKASESASLESSRKTGGQAGHLRYRLGLEGLRGKEQFFGASELGRPVRGPLGLQFNSVEEYQARSGELQDLEEVLKAEIARFSSVRVLVANVEAVLEPFKVRTISKGESIPYYLAKRFQLVLHGAMRKMDCFRLIGRPLCPTDLLDLVGQSNNYLDSTECSWMSIDYSAATDGLSARLSSEIMRYLLGNLYIENPNLYNMMLSVLAPHEVHYPKVAGKQLPPVKQLNGQLMGSVLSFPVLCLANLGLYLTVRRRTREWAPFKNLLGSVLINGDDMLYIGSKDEWDLHTILGKRIGLEMSPGKAYFHQRYANVNSTSIDLDLRSEKSDPWEIKFLNVGLLNGQHKVLGKVGSEDDDEIKHPFSAVIDEVVRGSLPGKQGEVFKLYCSMHNVELSKECRGANLFIPKVLGGMGVSPIMGIETSITAKQHSVAEARIRKLHLSPIQRPLPLGHLVEAAPGRKVDPIHLAVVPLEEDTRERVRPGPVNQNLVYPYWGDFVPSRNPLVVERTKNSDLIPWRQLRVGE